MIAVGLIGERGRDGRGRDLEVLALVVEVRMGGHKLAVVDQELVHRAIGGRVGLEPLARVEVERDRFDSVGSVGREVGLLHHELACELRTVRKRLLQRLVIDGADLQHGQGFAVLVVGHRLRVGVERIRIGAHRLENVRVEGLDLPVHSVGRNAVRLAAGVERQRGLLVHDHGHERVLAALGEVLVGDVVDDGRVSVGDHGGVAVEAVMGQSADERVAHGNGLCGVFDVGVGCKLDALAVEAFERDDLVPVRKLGAVELEGHVNGAVRLLGRERGLGRHRVAFRVLHRDGLGCAVLGRDLLVERARHGVLAPGHESCVAHGIGELHGVVGDDVLVAVGGVGERGADLRQRGHDGLALIGRVLMACQDGAVAAHLLEADELLAVLELEAVELEGDVDEAVRRVGRECGLCSHRVAFGIRQRLGGRLAVFVDGDELQRALDRVLAAVGEEVAVLHLVHDRHLIVGHDDLRSAGPVLGGSADGGLDRAQSLALIAEILVLGDRLAGRYLSQGLEAHELLAVRELAGVEHGIDRDRHVGGIGNEILGALDGVARGVEHGRAVIGVDQLHVKAVLGALAQVLRRDGVGEPRFGVELQQLRPVACRGGGGDGGFMERDRLLGVGLVRVLRDVLPA